MNKPDKLQDGHIKFLNNLQVLGMDMWGMRPDLMKAFPELGRSDASDILIWWMTKCMKKEEDEQNEKIQIPLA